MKTPLLAVAILVAMTGVFDAQDRRHVPLDGQQNFRDVACEEF